MSGLPEVFADWNNLTKDGDHLGYGHAAPSGIQIGDRVVLDDLEDIRVEANLIGYSEGGRPIYRADWTTQTSPHPTEAIRAKKESA